MALWQTGLQILSAIASVYMANLYFSNFFEKRNQQTGIIAVINIFVVLGVWKIESTEYGSWIAVMTVILYFLYEILLFSGQIFKQLFYGIIYVLLNLSATLMRGYVSNVNMNPQSVAESGTLGWGIEIDTLFIKMVLFIAVLFIIHYDRKNRDEDYDERIFRMFLIFPVTTCILLAAIFQSDIYRYGIEKNSGLLLIAVILLVVSNIVVQYMFEEYTIMKRKEEFERMTHLRDKMEEKYYKKVEKSNGEYMNLMHDMKQYLSAINAMAKNNKNEDILAFLKEIHCNINGMKNVVYSGNKMLNAILLEKALLAEERKLSYQVRIEKTVKTGNISDFDLVGIVGNIIDNALEAADKIEDEEKRYIQIEGYLSEEQHFLVFSVKNPIKCIPIWETGNFKTWKNDREKHGIGLQSVKNILGKNGGYMNIEVTEDMFVNTIFLPVE